MSNSCSERIPKENFWASDTSDFPFRASRTLSTDRDPEVQNCCNSKVREHRQIHEGDKVTHYFLGVSGVQCWVREFFWRDCQTVRYQNCCCKKPKVMFVPTSHFWQHPGKQDPQSKGVVVTPKVPAKLTCLQAGNFNDTPELHRLGHVFF